MVLVKQNYKACIKCSCACRTFKYNFTQLPNEVYTILLSLLSNPILFCFMPILLCVQDVLVAQMIKNLLSIQDTQVQSLGRGDPLEEGMATHSSMLAWRVPWTEEPNGLQRSPWCRTESDMTEQ